MKGIAVLSVLRLSTRRSPDLILHFLVVGRFIPPVFLVNLAFALYTRLYLGQLYHSLNMVLLRTFESGCQLRNERCLILEGRLCGDQCHSSIKRLRH
jgi:hypothetical protein